ncbi:MAG: host attachment protein [Steroidobacteraceae bacterium]
MSRFRILVADQAEAVFYDAAALDQAPTEVARINSPEARLHDRDLASDRPGRSYESVGGARHSISREVGPHRRQAELFARRVARRLDEARRRDEFEGLVVVAGPPFLALMRKELPRLTRARVTHEICKDLVHGPLDALRRHLGAIAAEGPRG